MPIKSVKNKISKNKKTHFFLMFQGSLDPKIRFIGQKVCSVARVHRKRKWKKHWRHVVNNTSWRTSFEESCLGSHCQHKSDTSLILNCGIWRYPCYYNLLQSIKDLDSSTLPLENKNNMISDVQLAIFANGLGVDLFLMVVLYHYVSVNNIKKLD